MPTLADPFFPAELLLEIFESLPYHKHLTKQLSAVNLRWRALMENYERSLTLNYSRRQLPHARIDFPTENLTHRWLSGAIKRYDILDSIMLMLTWKQYVFTVEPHNTAVVYTGFLLLYRISSLGTYEARVAYLRALKRDPLTAMYAALDHSVLCARYKSEGLISQKTYGVYMDGELFATRTKLEASFKEAALHLGPSFILDMLLHQQPSEANLLCFYHDNLEVEHADLEDRPKLVMTHGPLKNIDGDGKEMSLLDVLEERLSKTWEIPPTDLLFAIMDDAMDKSNHPLANIGLHGKEVLLKGLNMKDEE